MAFYNFYSLHYYRFTSSHNYKVTMAYMGALKYEAFCHEDSLKLCRLAFKRVCNEARPKSEYAIKRRKICNRKTNVSRPCVYCLFICLSIFCI